MFNFGAYSYILIFVVVCSSVLQVYLWKRRYTKGGLYLLLLLTAVNFWSLIYALELAAQNVELRVIFGKLAFFGIVPSGVLWLLFAQHYTGTYEQIKDKKLYLITLFIIPGFSLLAVFFNEFHHQFWTEVTVLKDAPEMTLIYSHGILFYILIAFTYSCLLAGSIILVRYMLNNKENEGRKIYYMLVAIVLPWLANFISWFNLMPTSGVEITPLSFVVSLAVVTLVIYKYSLFDIFPSAQAQLISHLEDGVIILNKQLNIVEANEKAEKIFGKLLKVSGNAGTIFSSWPVLVNILGMKDLPEKGEVQEILLTEAGASKNIQVTVVPIYGARGKEIVRLMILKDISAMRAVERGLMESEHKYSDIINTMSDGVIVADAQGKIIIWNKAVEELTGVKADQILNKNNYEVGWVIYKIRRPVLLDIVLSGDERALSAYEEVTKANDEYSCMIKVDELKGSKKMVIWCKAKKIFDPSGKVIGAIETVRDISDVRLATMEAAKAKSILEAVVENTSDIILFFDKDFHILSYNRAYVNTVKKLYGIDIKYGVTDNKTIMPEKNSWWLDNFNKAIKGEHFLTELDFADKNATRHTFEVAFNPVFINGKCAGVSNFMRDVTDRKQSENLLQEKIAELAKANELMVGRELKMIELKNELEKLKGSGIVH